MIDGNKFYINLWDDNQQRSRKADIDILKIRNSSKIDYGFAISSVIDALKSDRSKPENYIKKISVVIVGEPPVPEELLKGLRSSFGKVRKERE